MAEQEPVPVIADVIGQVMDKRRMSAGITACATRMSDFASPLQMQLAGIAMMPEARDLMTETLTNFWGQPKRALTSIDLSQREVLIGAGYHAAVYAACRVAMGYPKPVVLERGTPEQVGGAFANTAFWLNSRSRPGKAGLPDQDKALNYIPGGLLQPAMASSQEYLDSTLMAWLIRLTLAQYAEVYPGVTVTGLRSADGAGYRVNLETSLGTVNAGRAIDARGCGDPVTTVPSPYLLTFPQLMARMNGMFPLRGMQQVAIIGGGNAGLCAAESFLGIAPGNTSAIGLDYVRQVDLYATSVDGQTCEDFRKDARGRYIRLAQYMAGNASQPTDRLRIMNVNGYASPMPDGVLVNDRTYDMAVLCTGLTLPALSGRFSYFSVTRNSSAGGGSPGETVLAAKADPYEAYRIGPAASIEFSAAEKAAGVSAIPANKVAMFRLGSRTAALAALLKPLNS
jgi:hypothetical protein